MRVIIPVGLLMGVCACAGCDHQTEKPGSARLIKPMAPALDQPAPEISGADLDGKPFKLSDFKGKVVMLDFWGMWCGPCQMFLPHGKKLVETYKDRPFVAVGVNTDGDKALPKSSKNLAMRCWWDGEGAISTRWAISAFPTVYLIDHEGVIRRMYRGVPNSFALDDAIEKLVKNAEEKKIAQNN